MNSLSFFSFIPVLITAGISILILMAAHYFLFRRTNAQSFSTPLTRQLGMLGLATAVIIFLILTLPIGDSTRGQILSFLGIVVTAAIALSSTTFLGNMMAGLMIKAVRNFRVGDFIRVGENFGRVSELGLLHTEIQNEDRDLTTLPNLYLVTNAVKVVRSSGTVVSATITLGYDVPYSKVVEALEKATEAAELEDGFVHVMDLGDFSVTYRISGFLRDVKSLISARSRLRVCAMHSLHEACIEIVSPNFINQRQLDPNKPVIPRKQDLEEPLENSQPEKMIFDKADEAESLDKLNTRLKELTTLMSDLDSSLQKASDETQKSAMQAELQKMNLKKEYLEKLITKKKNENGG